MILQVTSAFFATAAFAVLFYLPKKYLFLSGMTGGVGWLIYLLMVGWTNHKGASTLVSTLVIALISHLLARIHKTPVTMFLIPGIIPLVPGAGMYSIAHSAFDNKVDEAIRNFFETFLIAGAIALGIFIIDTIFRAFKDKN